MITAIVCSDRKRGIGYKGNLLFKIKEDMDFFKEVTTKNPNTIVLMGRKTHESIGKVLPNRINVVLTRDPKKYYENDISQATTQPNLIYCTDNTFNALYHLYKSIDGDIYIIGGEEIYRKYINYCDTIIMTKVDKEVDKVDTFFPEFDESKYNKSIIKQGECEIDGENVKFTIERYTKCAE